MKTYGISIDADRVVIDDKTIMVGYIGWWSSLGVKTSTQYTRKSYYKAISDAISDAKQYATENSIVFINEGGTL